jgi:uncharacterized protein
VRKKRSAGRRRRRYIRGMPIDWPRVSSELDARGAAVLCKLVSRKDCESLAALYADEGRFRSRVVMSRHGFGRGEYQFIHALPDDQDALVVVL